MTKVQPSKPLSRALWWVFFLLATYVMSLWFQTFRVFTVVPSLFNGALWLAVMLLLVAVVGVLAYDSYVLEKNRGRIHKPVRLFEWLLKKEFLLGKQDPKQGERR